MKIFFEGLGQKILELKYLAAAEGFKDIHVDHDACLRISGLRSNEIEK